MAEHRDVHVHVEERDPRYEREIAAEESAAAASFFTSQLLWIALLLLLAVLIIAALGGGVIDLGGASDAIDPTPAP